MAVVSVQRLLRKETVSGNQLPRSDLRGHLGMGMGMSSREFIAFYRWCAAYCLEIAHDEDPGCKAALLSMAQTWRALADQVERAGGTTRGIPHPHSDEP